MTALEKGLVSLAATIAILALPSAARAAYLVPPENSAVNQYTETIPTAGGNSEAGKRSPRSPGKVLGERNARRLHAQGPPGQATAKVAAETAPTTGRPTGGGVIAADNATAGHRSRSPGPGIAGEAAHAGGSGRTSEGPAAAAQARGSSGLGEVVAHATGVSSEEGLGGLLPLAIVATVVWSVAYLVRHRKRPPAA